MNAHMMRTIVFISKSVSYMLFLLLLLLSFFVSLSPQQQNSDKKTERLATFLIFLPLSCWLLRHFNAWDIFHITCTRTHLANMRSVLSLSHFSSLCSSVNSFGFSLDYYGISKSSFEHWNFQLWIWLSFLWLNWLEISATWNSNRLLLLEYRMKWRCQGNY